MGGVVTGIMGAIGGTMDAQAKDMANIYNASELQRSGELAQNASVDALRQGEQDAGRLRMKGAEMAARQQLAYTASGIEASSGTALQVGQGTMLMSELDAQIEKNNALRKSLGYEEAARKYKSQSRITSETGKTEVIATGLNAAGQGMSALASAATFAGGGG